MPLRCQLSVLECGERIRRVFGFKKRALAFSGFAVVHHELRCGRLLSVYLRTLILRLSHALTVAILLPQKQVKLRYYAFLCVRMNDAQKAVFS